MTSFTRLGFCLALLVSASSLRGELTVSVRPVGSEAQGGYRAQPNERFEWVLAYYALGASKQPEPSGLASFGIVALDTRSVLPAGSVLSVSIKQQLRSDGRSGITAASAFLYEAYATGRLHQWLPGFAYDESAAEALQSAIRSLEGSRGLLSPAIADLLTAHFGSSASATERYTGSAVRVLTLTAPDGSSSDFLIYLPDPVTNEAPGMPTLGRRSTGGGGGGGGGFIGVNPPPVIPPVEDIDEIIEEIVTTLPPVIGTIPDGDITQSTPPAAPAQQEPNLPGIPENPYLPPVIDPLEQPRQPQPVPVPDAGATAGLLLVGLAAAVALRRSVRR